MSRVTYLKCIEAENRDKWELIQLPPGFLETRKNIVDRVAKRLKKRGKSLQKAEILCVAPNGEDVTIEIEPRDLLSHTANQPKLSQGLIFETQQMYYTIDVTFARKHCRN
jgi:hypothetical protein